MFKQLVLLLTISLSGCLLDMESKSGINKQLKGMWSLDTTQATLLHINDESFTHYYYVSTYDCYSQYSSKILNTNSNKISLTGNSNSTYDISWIISDSKLSLISKINTTIYTKPEISLDTIKLCSESISSKTVSVSIKFKHLPNIIQVNHQSTPKYQIEFLFDIYFDLNANGIIDHGDILFFLHHKKENGDTPETINTESFFASSSLVESDNGELEARHTPLTVHKYTVKNNIFSFQFATSKHIAFSAITPNTNLKIYTQYIDKKGEAQYDFFPDSGELTPSGTDLTNILDNADDAYGTSSEPVIVDIEEISIQFIE